MHAENFIGYYCCQGEILEYFVDFCKNRIWIIRIFLESLLTFLGESIRSVDSDVLVSTSKKVNLEWEFYFQSEEQTDDFKTEFASVNVVSKKEVVKTFHIADVILSTFVRCAILSKHSHKIAILTVDRAKYLSWRSQSEHCFAVL